MNWLRRLLKHPDPPLPSSWKPVSGTWCDQSGVMEGRCPPLETYIMPPRIASELPRVTQEKKAL